MESTPMAASSQRKPFLTLARLILFFIVGGLGALLHWLVLPEPPPPQMLTAQTAAAPQSSSGAAAAPAQHLQAADPARPSIGDILSLPYWQRMPLILAYLEGADAAVTADLVQALSPEITAMQKATHGNIAGSWATQMLFIFSHWAAVDAMGMMNQVNALNLGERFIYLAYSVWARCDWRAARAHPLAREHLALEMLTFRQEAIENPLGVLAEFKSRLRAHRALWSTVDITNSALKELSKTDPAAALRESMSCLALYPGSNVHQELNYMVRDLFTQQPEKGLQALQALALSDPKAASKFALQCGLDLVEKFPNMDSQMLALILSGEDQKHFDSLLESRQTKADPLAALEAARGMAVGGEREQAERSALFYLSRKDPRRCLHEISQIQDSNQLASITSDCLGQILLQDKSEALILAQGIANPAARQIGIQEVAGHWANQHPDATLEDIQKFYPGATADPQFMIGLLETRDNHPENLDLAKSATGPARDAVLGHVMLELKGSGKFWENLDSLPTDHTRADVISAALGTPIDFTNGQRSTTAPRVTQTLYHINPTEASTWVRDLPPGPVRDSATGSLVQQINQDKHGEYSVPDFDAAWRWATTIQDPQQRLRALRETASPWLKTDAAGLVQTINSAPLPESEKALLRTSFLLPHPAPP
jgi:hypothetical protein